MTGRIHYTPEAEQQLDDLDEWITKKASADTSSRFVRAIIDHVDEILAFPLAGRARDDIRSGCSGDRRAEPSPRKPTLSGSMTTANR